MGTQHSMNLPVVVPWLLTVATGAIGIWQFTSQQQQANRKPFLEKQLELSFQATETAGELSSETDPAKWEQARIRFWKLYWGPLSLVENQAVEAAMVELGRMVPAEPVPSPKLPMTALGVPSYRLVHAVRDLVLTSWNVDLPPLQGQRPAQK